jgi:hypothetical protein
MIPPLEDGVLPEGIHDCTIDEIDRVFGRFQKSDRRIRLLEKLKTYLVEARSVSFIKAVIIDGSFVMTKDEPDDIDLLVVLDVSFSPGQELKPFEYNAISRRAVKAAKYPFDLFAFVDGSEDYHKFLDLFAKVNPDKHAALTSRSRKGMLRVVP